MIQTSAKKQEFVPVESYLAFEEKSKRKHEYMDGEIFAMAGATRKHSKIASNIGIDLGYKLKGNGCEIHFGDLRIKASESHYVYADVSIFCENSEFETYKDSEILLTPKVVFEVLSKSTEARDRGDKAQDYRRLTSLSDYVLVSQKRIFVEQFVRQSDNSWRLFEFNELGQKLKLSSINCELSLADIYFEVNLPQLNLV